MQGMYPSGRRRSAAFGSYAPRARLFLKATAALVTAAFLLLTLQPLTLAADLTARRPSPPPPAPTGAERLSQTLEHIERHVGKLHDKLNKRQDITPEMKELKALRTEINLLDRQALADFDDIERHLKEKKLPPEILHRHTAAVKTYKTEMTALKSNLEEVYWANDDGERRLKAKKAREHLQAKQKKRPHTKFDPRTAPSHAPKSKQRQPRLRQQEFAELQPPIRLAFNGNISAWLLTQVALPLPTADDLAETPEVQFSPDIQRLVTLFERSPIALYEFVRNNFTFDPYYGSVRGLQGTLLLQSGNDIDQASVLIALYRAAGIPARYVYGTVEIPIDKAMKWLGGITNPNVVGEALVSNGIPARLIVSGGAPRSVELEHTWVEAYLPYDNYRGVVNDPNARKTWVPLDPSFKLHDPNPNARDLATERGFDADAFFTQYLQAFQPDTPAKEYLRNSIDYVTANIPGGRIYDLLSSGPIQEKVLELLPNTLPYATKVIGNRFSTVPDNLRHRVTIELGTAQAIDMSPALTYAATWLSLLHQRFTLSYEPATPADAQLVQTYGNLYDAPPYLLYVKPVLKLEGVTVAEGSAVPMGADLTFRMVFTAANGEYQQTVTNLLTAGATHAIALGSGYTNGRVVTDRTARWEAAVSQNETGDAIIGEFLNLFAVTYFQELSSSRKIVSRTMKLIDTNHQTEAMVGVDLVIRYSFGIPRTTTIGGLLFDVDRNISVALSLDGDHRKVRRFILLDGLTGSALEHEIFEKVLSEPTLPVQAVSAIKALQLATTQGIPVHRIDPTNLPTILPILQIGNDIKTDIQNAVANGWQAVVSERNVQLNSWNGVGYILLNPTTGEGYYRISGGLSGGLSGTIAWLKDEIKQGKMDEARAKEIIKKYRQNIWFRAPAYGGSIRAYGPYKGTDGKTYFHDGADIKVPILTPVHAVAAGRVIRAEMSDSYGWVIYLDHGLGVTTRYAHNCQLVVTSGTVEPGQLVALSGNTGRVESNNVELPASEPRCVNEKGAHVHFEIRLDDATVDPINFFGNKSFWFSE